MRLVTRIKADEYVNATVERLRRKTAGKQYSDVIAQVDGEELQFVDLVMEGGGVLGVALVGFTWALEQVNIRFLSIGGTSAGSINAALTAGAGSAEQLRAEKVLEHLSELNPERFVDGGGLSKTFARALTKALRKRGSWACAILPGLPLVPRLSRTLGFNRGDEFARWIDECLGKYQKWGALESRMRPNCAFVRESRWNADSSLRERMGTRNVRKADLAIIATDVTTGTLVRFPDRASLYFDCPAATKVSEFVRASMSVPYFFEPKIVRDIPKPRASHRWRTMVGYRGMVPEEVMFLDGGLTSNFPIDVFHDRDHVPTRPTFGVKLGGWRDSPNHIGGVLSKFGAAFSASRAAADLAFLRRNPDYQKLVVAANTDLEGIHWLDFSLTEEMQLRLFREGVRAAERLLLGDQTAEWPREAFDWQRYKAIRGDLARAEARAKGAVVRARQPSGQRRGRTYGGASMSRGGSGVLRRFRSS